MIWISAGCCEATSDTSEEELVEEVRKLYTDKEYTQAIQVPEWLFFWEKNIIPTSTFDANLVKSGEI